MYSNIQDTSNKIGESDIKSSTRVRKARTCMRIEGQVKKRLLSLKSLNQWNRFILYFLKQLMFLNSVQSAWFLINFRQFVTSVLRNFVLRWNLKYRQTLFVCINLDLLHLNPSITYYSYQVNNLGKCNQSAVSREYSHNNYPNESLLFWTLFWRKVYLIEVRILKCSGKFN